jgi:ATP-dependent Lon protease
VLTGQLGDVMKESGQAAFTFARWHLARLGRDDAALVRRQVHVHVPAGAIPKDGPSAGVTIAAALLSLATGVAVRHDVAMTGEITLRGRVLAVGGVREKALAALRAGIRTVVLPRANLPDLREIPGELARRIEFVPVETLDEALDAVLERPLAPARGTGGASARRRPATPRAPVATAKGR